jgi:hypothetical protein
MVVVGILHTLPEATSVARGEGERSKAEEHMQHTEKVAQFLAVCRRLK